MSIFDKLKKEAVSAVNAASAPAKDKEVFSFAALPESLAEMQALPEASLDSPFKTAALTVCALCAYGADKDIGTEMLNFLRGPRGPLTPADQQFLKDRFSDGQFYVPFSYFKGATPDNDYTPSEPFTLEITAGPYAYQNEGYASLDLVSGGADTPRKISLRLKPSEGKWYLNDQFIMVGIRTPKSKNPWA